MTQLIHQLLSSYILTNTRWVKGLFLLSSNFTPFPVLRHCFSHGCTIVLTEAARHDSFLTHFLTYLILHAGRIFWQRHCNRIVCLVVESALHVYKGQLSPWFGQFTTIQKIHNSDITGTLISWEVSDNEIHQLCFSHCTALMLDLQVWSVKNSLIWSQPYVIIAYIINFQVLSTPGQVQIRLTLYLFGIRLRINWVVELKKVSRTTASLALRETGPRAQN